MAICSKTFAVALKFFIDLYCQLARPWFTGKVRDCVKTCKIRESFPHESFAIYGIRSIICNSAVTNIIMVIGSSRLTHRPI